MKKERWFLICSVNITGFNGCYGTDIDEEIRVPLYAANQKDAERQAMIASEMFKEAAEGVDHKFFQKYCNSINDEDGLTFSDFRLICKGKGEKFEKKLDIEVPRLVGGS